MKKFLIISVFLFNAFLLDAGAKSLKVNEAPEKIYAVMITGKDDFHKSLAEKSVQSFLQQTYPNKHLIIVNDGNYSLGHLNQELITEIKLDKKYILGALRNIGIKQIPKNGIYLQWDDDDWHHPILMEEQYKYMKSQAADGCILQRQVTYCFSTNSAWISSPKSGKIGTIMCRLKGDVFYPEIAKNEDGGFRKDYMKKYKLIKWDNPAFYYLRFVHGHNTWDDAHFGLKKLKRDQWSISRADGLYLSKIIPLYVA